MPLACTEVPLCVSFDAALLDLDGVVYRAAEAVPFAVESLNQAEQQGMRLAYLTNNASRPASAVVGHLRELGLAASLDGVVTSAQAISRVAAEELPDQSTVLLIGGRGLQEPLESHGLRCVRRVADATEPITAVVQGYFPEVGWSDLAEAAYAIQDGARWFVSNTDLTIPTGRGIAPGNGSLVQAVRNATGVEPTIAGKPYAPLFDETLARLNPKNPLMVGDRLDTDIAGAQSAGIDSIAVLTGVCDVAQLVAADLAERPTFVAPDLRGLLKPHKTVELGKDSASCGNARAALRENTLVLESEGSDLENLRAIVELGWHVVDTRADVPRVDERIEL